MQSSHKIWIRSATADRQHLMRPLREALLESGVTILALKNKADPEEIERIRKVIWNSDDHAVLDGLTTGELRMLRGVFQQRKNFSVSLVDWWTSD
jgi:hypothetical protein